MALATDNDDSSVDSSTISGSRSTSLVHSVDNWSDLGDWLKHTVITLSIVNFGTLVLVIVSYAALLKIRRRCFELDLFLSCMERQIQRSVLPAALVQRAIEASNAGSVREVPSRGSRSRSVLSPSKIRASEKEKSKVSPAPPVTKQATEKGKRTVSMSMKASVNMTVKKTNQSLKS